MTNQDFLDALQAEAAEFTSTVATPNGDWIVKGFIDIHQRIYTISVDTKIVSKVLELLLFPAFERFADKHGFQLELSSQQNFYPDLTFVDRQTQEKFAVDIKSTYRVDNTKVNGMTLGAFTGYFRNRASLKNTLYPYGSYSGHFVLGVIYSQHDEIIDERKQYWLDDLAMIQSVIRNFTFFAQPKYRIASASPGSGNTKNIGSVAMITALTEGTGPFASLGEDVYDDYWIFFKPMPKKSANWRKKKHPLPKKKTDPMTILVPPLKCQGIKTKLVPAIQSAAHGFTGRWIEPFCGSSVVAFNLRPEKALLTDTNRHIIRFYTALQSGEITPALILEHLRHEGEYLSTRGEQHYYEVRARFNEQHSPLDFLFLNRSCFNGVMRFNKKGGFNVPFCRKPDRFAQAYVTKIVNQVRSAVAVIRGNDWTFQVADFRSTLRTVCADDFVYADPPYMGRHVDYFNSWKASDEQCLTLLLKNISCGFILSTWQQNQYRQNESLQNEWNNNQVRIVSIEHFYHVGASEDLRHSMMEALITNNLQDLPLPPQIPHQLMLNVK